MNVALLGFGTIGSAFYELTRGREDIVVKTVLSRRPRPELTCRVTAEMEEILADPDIHIVVEVMGGLHPAYEYICAAMEAGKHVVTANKELMVAHYSRLVRLARERGVCLRCTGAAGGGLPWLTSLTRAARLDELTAVEGILNDTTDQMLRDMTQEGLDYGAALLRAQQAGLAEADPSADVDGLDALRKLVLSVDLGFGVCVREEDIPRLGISSVRTEDMAAFRDMGLVCKLFTRAEKGETGVAAFVMPTLFRPQAYQVHTGVSLYGRRFGRQSFSGKGTGPKPSAFSTGGAVLGDCLDILEGCGTFYYAGGDCPCPVDNSGVVSRFYYRIRSGSGLMGPMSVRDAFLWIEETRRTDPGAFFARLEEEN